MSFILEFLDEVNFKVNQVKQQASDAVEDAKNKFQGLVGIGIGVVVLLALLLIILIIVQVKKMLNKKKSRKKIQKMAFFEHKPNFLAYDEVYRVSTIANETQV